MFYMRPFLTEETSVSRDVMGWDGVRMEWEWEWNENGMRLRMEWDGMRWNEMERDEMRWNEMRWIEWVGMGWDELGQIGTSWDEFLSLRLHFSFIIGCCILKWKKGLVKWKHDWEGGWFNLVAKLRGVSRLMSCTSYYYGSWIQSSTYKRLSSSLNVVNIDPKVSDFVSIENMFYIIVYINASCLPPQG